MLHDLPVYDDYQSQVTPQVLIKKFLTQQQGRNNIL